MSNIEQSERKRVTGTVKGKLVRTVLVILAAVAAMILAMVHLNGVKDQKEQQAETAELIKKSIVSKGKILTENHAIALRGMVEDNAFGDVKNLIARTLRDDPEIVAGLFLPAKGEPWAYFSPTHPPLKDSKEVGEEKKDEEWKTLQLQAEQVSATEIRVMPSTWFGSEVYTFAKAVEGDGERLGTVHYGLSTNAMKSALARSQARSRARMNQQLLMLGSLALGGMLLGWLLAMREARRITQPLGVLTNAAQAIASGKRGARANITCGDEVEVLAGAFNQMVSDLEASQEQLEAMNQGLEEKVKSRTKELSLRNAEMRVVLDNVEEGLVTLSLDGTLSSERSAAFERSFQVPANDTKLWECLGSEDQNFLAGLEFSWEQVQEGFLPWSVSLGQLPSSFSAKGRHYHLEFKPLLSAAEGDSEPELTGALLIAMDVTDRLSAERKQAEQREEMAIFRRIMKDRAGFMEFFNEVLGLFQHAVSGEITEHQLMMRTVHTIKGNCAIFGIDSVARVCHELESWVVENEAIPERAKFEPLVLAWEQFAAKVAELVGSDETTSLEIEERELVDIIEDLKKKRIPPSVTSNLEYLLCEPTARRFMRIGEQAGTLAKRLGKEGLQIAVDDSGIRLPAGRWGAFWGSMIHVIRNALDHGIETPGVRTNAGKVAHGTLTLRSLKKGNDFVIEVADDGAGINWDGLKKKAMKAGLPTATQADLMEALFADGVSSRDETTELSGRGVGMGAVRAACRDLGGRVEVVSVPGKGTTFSFSVPIANNDKVERKAS